MKEQIEKQAIEEIARGICHLSAECKTCQICNERYNTDDELCYFQCVAKEIINNGYRKQEWISVEERLPKNYRPVLVACEGLTIGGYAPIAIGSYGGGFWSIADADGTAYLTKYMRCTVTHWMPLPEPPKMKGGAE